MMERTRSGVCVVGTKATKGAAGIGVVGLTEATTTKTAAERHFEGRRSRNGWSCVCDG